MRDTRVVTRIATAVAATLVGGSLGAFALAPTAASAAACPTGEHQRAVEVALNELGGFGRLTVDGRQSTADCAAIKKFQQRYDIRPVAGRAGPLTHDVSRRLVATSTAACKAAKKGTTICVDLTHQTVFVMRDGKVSVKPTVTRTGMKGYRTPTGSFTINKRTRKEWSEPYEVWMPYWQRFVGGIGFHETTTYLHDGWRGSHGCINLLPSDAEQLYGLGKIGMRVKVFGKRPGT